MKVSAAERQRIRKELRQVGFIGWSLLSMETRYLPAVIHKNEHIKAAIYGIYKDGTCILVATNLRIIFLDRKPLYTVMDEVTYDMVAGVRVNNQVFFSGVTLHTRVREFVVNYVTPRVANHFSNYIEKRRIETTIGQPLNDSVTPSKIDETSKSTDNYLPMTEAAKEFLKNHKLATLSSVDRDGNVHGAVVYYTLYDDTGSLYMLTKTGTQKAHNITANPKVALTVYDEKTLQTLQLQAKAKVETNQDIKNEVFAKIVTPKWFNNERRLPPVAELTEGSYIVFSIKPTGARFSDYRQLHRS